MRLLHKRSRVILVAALTAALILASHATGVRAYTTSGDRFQSATINYQLGTLTSYDRTAFLNGISDWDGTGTPIWFVQSSSNPRMYLYDENDGNNGYIGYEDDSISGFWCQNGYNQTLIAYVKLNTYYTSGMQGDIHSIESTAGHELGHGLGLNHVTFPALMYPSEDRYYSWGIYKPQQDDENGVNYIYGSGC